MLTSLRFRSKNQLRIRSTPLIAKDVYLRMKEQLGDYLSTKWFVSVEVQLENQIYWREIVRQQIYLQIHFDIQSTEDELHAAVRKANAQANAIIRVP